MFTDRSEAGRRLGRELLALGLTDPVVLALPRGGVPVGYEVARALGVDLDVLIVRKLGVPWNPEYAFGAIGEGGARVVDDQVVRSAGLTAADVDKVVAAETAEIARRSARYRGDHDLSDIAGRVVIIVDDGLATGSTMAAAIAVVRQLGAGRVVVAVPVGAHDTVDRIGALADEVVCLAAPRNFRAVGLHYRDFEQVPDAEVIRLLRLARTRRPPDHGPHRGTGQDPPGGPLVGEIADPDTGVGVDAEVTIPAGLVRLPGHLAVPAGAIGVVLFAHGSGSSRFSSRNQYVADVLRDAGIGTLLFDLLTADEAGDRGNVFDIQLLAGRLVAAADWLRGQPGIGRLPVGYFGASTGAGAALVAAARRPELVDSVVSRGGRPDLAGRLLPLVGVPTLLIVGGNDFSVLDLNRAALAELRCPAKLKIVPGATHLFEEPGTLRAAAELARDHFRSTLSRARAD